MKFVLASFLFFTVSLSVAQDSIEARRMVKILTSPYFWGRGYTNEGLQKTADFLIKELCSYGVMPLTGENFRQEFSFPVNTFPGKMELKLNGTSLSPGKDFIVSPESKSLNGSGKLMRKDSLHFFNVEEHLNVSFTDKLTWSVSQKKSDYTTLFIRNNLIKDIPESFDINIQNLLISNFPSANLCGIVRGTAKPDSMIFMTAHYDHLGGMGDKTYFPGANDNASGVSLLLSLAKYYAHNPQKYSMVFIFFAAEEAGLVGSKYFTEHPLVDLKKIRFLINTDLVGTGEEGITVVNATEYKKEFELLHQINEEGKYLVKINPRAKAANSDHYWFTEKGVPSFFIYTLGGIKAYHDIYDRSETLPLTEHEDLFRLMVRFNASLMGTAK